MKEFTFNSYENIIQAFQSNDYNIVTFSEYIKTEEKKGKYLILRHDVDRFPLQTLQMARLEAVKGIKSTYFFRIIPAVFKPEILAEVASLGHEIGYHYEDLTLCNGNHEKAIEHFKYFLEQLRNFFPVQTICMHGSPMSKWDNKTIWEKFDFRNYGIIADTSLNIDYNRVFYISDNGRAWNRLSVSIRDKVDSELKIPIKNTHNLVYLIRNNKIHDQVMLNIHPDTFFDFGLSYLFNWGFIETKNIVKWFVVKFGLWK